jgi:hypothetical protein
MSTYGFDKMPSHRKGKMHLSEIMPKICNTSRTDVRKRGEQKFPMLCQVNANLVPY